VEDENCTLLREFRNGSQFFCTCNKNSKERLCLFISCNTWAKSASLKHKMVLECSYALSDPGDSIFCPGWLSNRSEIITYLQQKSTLNRVMDRQTGGTNSDHSIVNLKTCVNINFMHEVVMYYPLNVPKAGSYNYRYQTHSYNSQFCGKP
jgi:hypothetical protein